MERKIEKLEITKLASGEVDPGAIPGENLLREKVFDENDGLPAGEQQVFRFYEDDTLIPVNEYYDTLINLDHAAGIDAAFPFMVHEDMFAASHNIFSYGDAAGGDIQVWNEARTVRYPVHVLDYDAGSEKIRVAARVPALAQNDKIVIRRILAGGAQPARGAQYGVNEVWQDEVLADADLQGHLGSGGEDDTGASTLTNFNGTPTGLSGFTGMAYMGGAGEGASFNYTTDSPAFCERIFCNFSNTSPAVFWKGQTRLFWQGYWTFDRGYSDGVAQWSMANPQVSPASPLALAVKHDGASPTAAPVFVVNGAIKGAQVEQARGGSLSVNTSGVRVGGQPAGESVTGPIALYRRRHTLPSDAWLVAEQVNILTPAAFASADAGALV